MTITPKELRENAELAGKIAAKAVRKVERGALAFCSQRLLDAADEIERLQSDVTELMSAANEALNDPRLKP